jgi:hypothetical protein
MLRRTPTFLSELKAVMTTIGSLAMSPSELKAAAEKTGVGWRGVPHLNGARHSSDAVRSPPSTSRVASQQALSDILEAEMGGVVPANGGAAPLPMETRFISSDDRAVLFKDFVVGQTAVRKEHDDFIKNILVPHYINQIESLRFSDKVMTLRPIGKASATGARDKNMELSIGRARNIGLAIKKHFDAQKQRGAFARNIEVQIVPKGEGDQDERELLGGNLDKISPKVLEANSNAFRSVLMSMRMQHVVVDDDEKIVCRQILNMKLKAEKVPANLLEQKIDELQQQVPPWLAGLATEALATFKVRIKPHIEKFLAAAEISAPEIFLLFKTIDFLIPSNIVLLFEFNDARGGSQHYKFAGSANKVDLSLIDVISQLLSLLIWLKKTPETLDALEKRIEQAKDGKLPGIPKTTLEQWKSAIKEMKLWAGRAKTAFDVLTAPGSILRRKLGDELVDIIVKAVNIGTTLLGVQIATDFATVHFESKGLFDIRSFGGVARTQTEERFLSATTVALDFAARSNQSLLGFQGHVVMVRKFMPTLTLLSHEQSNGTLKPVQRPVA